MRSENSSADPIFYKKQSNSWSAVDDFKMHWKQLGLQPLRFV